LYLNQIQSVVFRVRLEKAKLESFRNRLALESFSRSQGSSSLANDLSYMESAVATIKRMPRSILPEGIVWDVVYDVISDPNSFLPGPGAITGPAKIAGGLAAKASKSIWSSTSKLSSVKNAFGHWTKHSAEFPEFLNAKQYVEGAKYFLHNSPAGTLMKIRPNGDILKYHSGTNTFGVMDATGVPRTMFRPTDGMKYWLGQ
jgi:hypothetical protein